MRRHALTLPLLVLVLGCTTGTSSSPPTDTNPTETMRPSAAPSAAAKSSAPAPSANSEATPAGPGHFAAQVDIGGRSLFLECDGGGGPTIVLDAGLGGDSGIWGRTGFLPLLSPISRWCVYDRANRGLSDADARPRTSSDIVDDLHALLGAAELASPYLLVGRSFGGYNVRLYASRYPDEVAGVVLIDTVTPGFIDGLEARLTPDQWKIEAASYRGGVEPYLDFLASGDEVAAADPPPADVPLLVIAATDRHLGSEDWPADWPGPGLNALWDAEQQLLAGLTPGGRLVVAEDTAHLVQIQRPEYTAGLLADVIEEIRAGP